MSKAKVLTSIIKVPLVKQKHEYDCGAAVTASVMQAIGSKMKYRDIMASVGTTARYGTGSYAIHRFIEREAKPASAKVHYKMSTKRLMNSLFYGNPVLIIIQAWASAKRTAYWLDEWKGSSEHYVILCGYTQEYVIMMDPAVGKYSKVSWPEFLMRWRTTTNTLLGSLFRSYFGTTMVLTGLDCGTVKVNVDKLEVMP